MATRSTRESRCIVCGKPYTDVRSLQDACNETHMLALFADYDPAPENIRKRFTLTGAEARNFDWYLDFAPDAAGRQELRASLPTKDNARVKMIERQEKAYVGALTLHSTNIKTQEQHMQRELLVHSSIEPS